MRIFTKPHDNSIYYITLVGNKLLNPCVRSRNGYKKKKLKKNRNSFLAPNRAPSRRWTLLVLFLIFFFFIVNIPTPHIVIVIHSLYAVCVVLLLISDDISADEP